MWRGTSHYFRIPVASLGASGRQLLVPVRMTFIYVSCVLYFEMFVVTIDSEKAHSIFSPVGAFVSDCNVDVCEDGVNISAVDDARIGLVNVDIGSGAFKSFESSGESFNLPINRFLNVLDLCVDLGEELHIMFNESENTLEIGCGGLFYSLSLLEKGVQDAPEVPELDFTSSATFKLEDLDDAVSAGNVFSDFVTFRSNNSKMSISGGGENNAKLIKSDEELFEFKGGKADSTFKASYFSSILNLFPDGEKIKIKLGVDYPVLIEASLEKECCDVEYVLAPRIKAED